MLQSAWTTLQPVLLENGGWAAFITTPKDEGHAFELYNYARQSQDWFCELLTVRDTRRDAEGENGAPVITESDIGEIRREKQATEQDIQREYYCSWKGFLHGTIFGDLIMKARLEKRIGRFPYTINSPVGVCFDIGVTDMTAMWFYQLINQQIAFIDYHEDNLKTAQHFAKFMRQEKPYIYGRLILPWDARWSAGDYFVTLGFQNVDFAKKVPIQVGIDQVRELFSRFYFDEANCQRGIQCLEKYARPWDPLKHTFGLTPIHDEFSHGASAMRTGAIGGFSPLVFDNSVGTEVKVESEFDPRAFLMEKNAWNG